VEFACNRAPHKTTGLSPFQIVYGVDPLTPRDLVPRVIKGKPSTATEQRLKEIQALNEKIRRKI